MLDLPEPGMRVSFQNRTNDLPFSFSEDVDPQLSSSVSIVGKRLCMYA